MRSVLFNYLFGHANDSVLNSLISIIIIITIIIIIIIKKIGLLSHKYIESRFTLTVEQILAFTSNTNLVERSKK